MELNDDLFDGLLSIYDHVYDRSHNFSYFIGMQVSISPSGLFMAE